MNTGAGQMSAGLSPGQSLSQYLGAARRRLRPMAVTFGVIFGGAVLGAVFWPPTYRSSGTILIEQQEIPTDVVRSAVTSYADQRVQVISQRVMTTANLLNVIEKYDLFPGERETMSREALVDRIREDIDLTMISADVVDPRQGRATKATIAFAVSYDARSPVVAARVANELTTLYLSENIETRKQLAADTAGFLKGESARLNKRVAELEQQIADFKTKHAERLPEFNQLNIQLVERSEQEMRDLNARIRALDQQIVFLDSQLAMIDRSGTSVISGGERILTTRDRLKLLRASLASAQGVYGPDHPDVLRLKREVGGLERELGIAPDASNDIARQLEVTRAGLATAREKYDAEHPDVKRLERQIASLEEALRNAPARSAPPPQVRDEAADNPAYIQIRAQKVAAENERAALREQQAQVNGRILDLERRQAQAPEVEREYSALVRELQNEQSKFAEVRQKELDAQLVENLETERKGERFTLIEPPMQPQSPVSPNRVAILVLGFVLGLGAAVGLMLLLETVDTRIRDRAHVGQLLGVPPLAVIPMVELAEDIAARLDLRKKMMMAGAGAMTVAVLLIHFVWRPLDVVWIGLVRRFGG